MLMCPNSTALTPVYCICVHMCIRTCVRLRVCFQACVRVGCVEIQDAPVLNKWPPCLCGFLPGVPDAWIMWCAECSGATLAQSSWDCLWMWPCICIEWRNGSSPLYSLQHIWVAGEECARPTPAGRIRCYLSNWGHRHQSLLSTFLCPESNQQRVIHLRWRHADKISNRVCQNVAMFAWCAEKQ